MQVVREIRAEMGRQGVNQADVSRRSGLKESYVSSRFRGKYPFNINDLDAIGDALDINASTLLRRAEKALLARAYDDPTPVNVGGRPEDMSDEELQSRYDLAADHSEDDDDLDFRTP